MGRKRYTEAFKREAVAMTRLPGATLEKVGKDLGINPGVLGRWRRSIDEHGEQAFPGEGNARDEEVVRLKRELAKVRKERDFLKEAAAFFAKKDH